MLLPAIQRLTEEMLLKMVNHLHEQTGLDHLVMAGGVGLNSVANGRIMRESPVRASLHPAGGRRCRRCAGRGALRLPRAAAAAKAFHHGACLLWRGLRRGHLPASSWNSTTSPIEFVEDEPVLVDAVSDALVSGQVIGLFQGRFEWGPRALGNRSILADPRTGRDEEDRQRQDQVPRAVSTLCAGGAGGAGCGIL